MLAYANDAPYLGGRLPLLEPTPEQREAMLAMPQQVREIFSRPLTPVAVNRTLGDGERLTLAGGLKVIFTPGHAPGHICLYLERSRAWVSSDVTLWSLRTGVSEGQEKMLRPIWRKDAPR